MNRRIKLSILGVTTLALLVFFFASLYWIRDRFESTARQDLDSYLSGTMYLYRYDQPEEDLDRLAGELASAFGREIRVTVTDRQGNVLGDSYDSPLPLSNHLDRPEFSAALQNGYGYSIRGSETTGIRTIYVARPWGEDYLLRMAMPVAVTQAFVVSLLPGFLVLVLAVFALASLLANRMTLRVTAPYDKMFAAIETALQRKDKTVEFTAEYEEMEPVVTYFRTVLSQISGYIAQISAKTEQIEHITSSMEEGLVMLDEAWEIALINRQGSEMLGIPQDTWQKNITYLYRNQQFLEALRQTKAQRRQVVADIPGRDANVLRFYINPVPAGGYVMLISDVTELIQLERVRSDFAANVSHELKTPLTSISGFAELIGAGLVTDSGQIRDYAGKILTESRRLVMLIDDILRLSSIEGGAQDAEEPVPLREVFDYTVQMLRNQMEERGLSCTVDGSMTLRASRQRMMELAFNLVDNAIKYNCKGGSIAIRMEGDRLEVENTGDFIPPEHQSRIFERFYRVDAARSRRTGGTGLGLSISKHIVEQHGGGIQVASRELEPGPQGQGPAGATVFTMIFPLGRIC